MMPKRSARKKITTIRSRKSTKVLTKMLVGFTVFFVSLVFLGGFTVYKRITKGFASAYYFGDASVRNASFYGLSYFVIDSLDETTPILRKASFVIIDEGNSKTVRYDIPLDLIVDVPGRYGEEPISNVFALGALNNGVTGGLTLTNATISKLFGFPTDKFILVSKDIDELAESVLSGNLDWSTVDIPQTQVFSSFKTDMSIDELIYLFKFSSQLPPDRFIRKDLVTTYIENQPILDEEIQDITFDSQIAKEKLSLAILNASGVPNTANLGARIVRNLGGRVVAVGNANVVRDKSVLISDNPESITVKILKEVFNIDNVLTSKEAINFTDSEVTRAEISIFLGLDFAESL